MAHYLCVNHAGVRVWQLPLLCTSVHPIRIQTQVKDFSTKARSSLQPYTAVYERDWNLHVLKDAETNDRNIG